MTAEEAIAAARTALREQSAVQATALRVTRLDVAGQCYWLVILGDDDAVIGVAAIAGRPPLALARSDGSCCASCCCWR